MRDLIEFLSILVPTVVILCLGIALLFGSIFGIDALVTRNYCNAQMARSPNFNIQWSLWTGCQVETADGLWVNYGTFATNENGVTIKLKTK